MQTSQRTVVRRAAVINGLYMLDVHATNPLLEDLQVTTDRLVKRFSTISSERKAVLQQLTEFMVQRSHAGQPVYLNFICTHNSRRSHMSQLWAQAAAYYYGVPHVYAYSGGTEATAFNPRAVNAMAKAGFDIVKVDDSENPTYAVGFAVGVDAVTVFSKTYNDPFNTCRDFAAVMTCSDADENCPLITGATARIALTYHDPKAFDGTDQEVEKYTERAEQIGTEILYAFYCIDRVNIATG